jgi:UDP-2-acetamido-3-amino-2,3-dideoxy-glucuronate N-acetyltransferase
MPEAMSIGLVGAGRWGMNYVRNLAALGVLGAVCDQDEQALVRVEQQFPNVSVMTSVDELARKDGIAGVVVATDTHQHHPVALRLLEAGKHCHVEKPLTDSAETARELCEFAASRELVLMVGHIRPWSTSKR